MIFLCVQHTLIMSMFDILKTFTLTIKNLYYFCCPKILNRGKSRVCKKTNECVGKMYGGKQIERAKLLPLNRPFSVAYKKIAKNVKSKDFTMFHLVFPCHDNDSCC